MKRDVEEAIRVLRSAHMDGRNGLPQELFLLISSLTPVPNVDLWITDSANRVLLSWRKDPFYDEGWHIPGGCLRFGETMAERIHQMAIQEIGCDVTFDPEPMAVRDVIRPPRAELLNPDERGHNLAVLYRCRLPEGFCIDNGDRQPGEAGYLQWFERIPDNLLRIQDVYRDILKDWL